MDKMIHGILHSPSKDSSTLQILESSNLLHGLKTNWKYILHYAHGTCTNVHTHRVGGQVYCTHFKWSSSDGSFVDIPCGTDGCNTTGPENTACFPIEVPADDTGYPNQTCLKFVRTQEVLQANCQGGTYTNYSTYKSQKIQIYIMYWIQQRYNYIANMNDICNYLKHSVNVFQANVNSSIE